jgi:hypothetical protein
MARSKLSALAVGLALGLAWASPAHAQTNLFKSSTTGNPKVQSIDAIGFGPQGLLIIGDSKGGQIVAVNTGDTTPQNWSRTDLPKVNEELAGRLGTTAKGIEITKLAVNPASRKAYIAVRKLADKSSVLLTLDGTGKINEFALDNVKYARAKLPAQSKINLITDVTWADDRILAAVQANDTFGSRIVSIPVPLQNDSEGVTFSTETFHVAHNKWETKAPIRTVLPYSQDGKKYLVGAFTCTPLVKYSLDDLQPGAKVKGTSVVEVGNGNTPRDMFTYEKGGKTYILMSTFRMFHSRAPVGPSPYWTVKLDHTLLTESKNINEKALRRVQGKTLESRTDRATVVDTFHGVTHMDRLDNERALVIRTDDKGAMNLAVLALP